MARSECVYCISHSNEAPAGLQYMVGRLLELSACTAALIHKNSNSRHVGNQLCTGCRAFAADALLVNVAHGVVWETLHRVDIAGQSMGYTWGAERPFREGF
jgi:hypothetical protein